ncbi:hypothetical protein IEQ34_023806 [Dendrobium chrysotoxum]|uniref:NAD(P)H-quinone oxidoreductase subunit 6, chloroplastic n=1 Tax=Dendrobium chrysotoxum TaxID=161865 RepID=A0AAV7FVC4_DENCH|nr:hypothetical protein IEQ34_023806 [Dendrobium chrysotoxum]
MDLPGPIHDILVVFLGSVLILGGLGVVLLTNPIDSAFSLGLVLVCISLLYISLNSYFVAAAQFLIYVGAINVFICCDVHERFRIWTAIRLDCSCILWLWVVSQLCGSRFSDIQAASEPAQFALIFLGRGSGGSKAKRALLEGI